MPTDDEIIQMLRRREDAGLEALLRTHGSAVKGWLAMEFGLPRDCHELEEAVHDAALILWRKAGRLDAEKSLRGYFTMCTRRELLRLLERREKERGGLLLPPEILGELEGPDGAAPDNQLSERFRRFVAGLPDLERQLLMYDWATGFVLKARELAAELGTTANTVYALRDRTKKRIARWLDDGEDGDRDGEGDE